jgi:two-component system cell cycle sensor histidine kinase/response regulator CckA
MMDTILVVDDERLLSEVWRRVLERRGYRVLFARDGEEALTVYRNNRSYISAVLLDFGLPKLDGREVYLKLKDFDPNVRVLLVSGYLSPEELSEIEPVGTLEFLQKPIMPDDLLATLDRLLHRPPSLP